MSDERQSRNATNWNNLLNRITISKERVRTGKDNEERLQLYLKRKSQLEKWIVEYKNTCNHLNRVYKNIKDYARQHQNSGRAILDYMILTAGNMVPDADTNGMRLYTDEHNRTMIVNARGQDVNSREGGGYRAVLGALLRYAALKAQPDALQLMFFDEYFFTLSDTTTQSMKDIFQAMKKDITIICVEQRKNIMDGILDSEYLFQKDDKKNTTVTKVI